jgi:hypothetical protein
MSTHRPRSNLSRAARWGLLLGALPLLAGCTSKSKTEAVPSPPSAPAAEAPAPLLLEIDGFNYSDLYIDSFEVNGHGGGNLFVSSPDSGGGGGTCCVAWSPGSTLPIPLKITWTRDGKRRCEQDVELKGPFPASPRHLGVHFFPDGHLEAEVTEDYPTLKLSLERVNTAQRKPSENTIADEHVARCHDAK